MRIMESFIQGKAGSLERCEDALFISDDFICVIDGVTSKSHFSFHNQSTGQLAGTIIKRTVEQFDREISSAQAVEKMTSAIAEFYNEHQLLDRCQENVTERLAACVIIFSVYHREIWNIGDCQCMIDQQTYAFSKAVDDIISEARALFIATELQNGKTIEQLLENDSGREFVLPLIKRAMRYQNSPGDDVYSYPVIDGFKVNPQHIRVLKLPEGTKEIVLASDGYPVLFSTLEQSEVFLERIIKTDPLCYKYYKSTKGLTKGNISFDDRTYVKAYCGQ